MSQSYQYFILCAFDVFGNWIFMLRASPLKPPLALWYLCVCVVCVRVCVHVLAYCAFCISVGQQMFWEHFHWRSVCDRMFPCLLVCRFEPFVMLRSQRGAPTGERQNCWNVFLCVRRWNGAAISPLMHLCVFFCFFFKCRSQWDGQVEERAGRFVCLRVASPRQTELLVRLWRCQERRGGGDRGGAALERDSLVGTWV